MHALRGNGAREKTALMPDSLWRSSFSFTTLDSAWDLILDTILAVTNSYSTVSVLLWDCTGSLTRTSARSENVTPPPSGDGPGYPLPC